MNSVFLEQALISAIRSRNPAGPEMLYDAYAVNLYRVILSIVRGPELAAEVLEQTFVTIWSSFDGFTAQENRLGIWGMGQAKKAAKDKILQNSTGNHFVNTELSLADENLLNGMTLV